MAFTLPPLPYPKEALEPFVDAQTMEIHHGKHHNAYVTNLNKALEGQANLQSKTIEQLIGDIKSLPAGVQNAVRNNGGGHWNHSMFWKWMGAKKGGKPTGDVAKGIDKAFGTFDDFKKKFAEAALARFGSGWTWLGVKDDGSFCICSTPNQDNPLMKGITECPCAPILGLDVWEHAYYLKYQNRRADYVEAWWNAVNWDEVGKTYTEMCATGKKHGGGCC